MLDVRDAADSLGVDGNIRHEGIAGRGTHFFVFRLIDALPHLIESKFSISTQSKRNGGCLFFPQAE
jgi:hypothetical protein